MVVDISSLPKKVPELHNVIILYSKRLEDSHTENKEQAEKIALLEEEVKLLRKLRFAHRSEKWTKKDTLQALLFDEAESGHQKGSEESQHPNTQTITVTYTRQKRAGRRKLDPSLPRKDIEHDLPAKEKQCNCGKALEKIGEDVREELDFQPAKYWVNRHVYPKYVCKSCTDLVDESQPEVRSAVRNALIPKSFASPGLLAYLFTSKFEDHLPFYRMERIFSRLKVTLPRASMCNWAIQVGNRLEAILESMRNDMMRSSLIMADETTLQVLKEPGRENTSKSYMWLFRGELDGKAILLYQYHPGRSGKVARDFLKDYKGALLSDGYAGYNEAGGREGMIHAGCWAHVRRKFKEADDVMSTKNTEKALSMIQSLYLVEKKIRLEEMGLDKILSLRQKKSKPIVEEFKEFLYGLHVPPESLLGKAIGYALGQWDKLLPFLEIPYIPIDNNRIENDIRPFVLGRKNWLFSGSPRGAHASCAIYSLIQTAKANGLEAYVYLRYLFEKLAENTTGEQLAELAPHKVTPKVLDDYQKTLV